MSEQLERRYARLLALFPVAHRREYEDEMLGVLMATARPQQRFPGLRETANLIGCAVWMRLSGRGMGSADARWAPAAAAYGLLAALLMLVHQLRVLAGTMLWNWRIGDLFAWPLPLWLPLTCWAVAVAAAFTRFRVAVVAAAWTAALCQAAVAFADYPTWPSGLVEGWPTLVFAISAALALTGSGSARGPAVLGPGRTLLMSLSFAVLAALPAVETALAHVQRYPDDGRSIDAWGGLNLNTSGWSGRSPVAGWLTLVVAPICVLLLLVCLARLAGPVRRRIMAMAAPTLLMLIIVPPVFNGFLASTVRFNPPVLLQPGQWVFLVALPVFTFIAAVLLVERAERRAYLIGLGRAAERQARLDPGSPSP
jgi:hypothetical protein